MHCLPDQSQTQIQSVVKIKILVFSFFESPEVRQSHQARTEEFKERKPEVTNKSKHKTTRQSTQMKFEVKNRSRKAKTTADYYPKIG